MLKMKIVYGGEKNRCIALFGTGHQVNYFTQIWCFGFFVSTVSSSKYMSTYNIVHRVHKETSKYHHIAAE